MRHRNLPPENPVDKPLCGAYMVIVQCNKTSLQGRLASE